MNRALPSKHDQNSTAVDPIDAILDAHFIGGQEDLRPSSGFTLSVMEAIQAQASEPEPIVFPWRRVVPGMIAIVLGLIALVIFAVRSGTGSTVVAEHPAHLALSLKPSFTAGEIALGWVLAAACLSIAAVAASFRLAGRSR